MTPEEAFKACLDAELREETLVKDKRAGICEISTLSPTDVFLTTERGNRLYAGTAVDFFKGYQRGSIQLIEDKS